MNEEEKEFGNASGETQPVVRPAKPLEPAPHVLRFFNWLIDNVVFSLIVIMILLNHFGNTPAGMQRVAAIIADTFIGAVELPFLFSVFMSLQETILRGKSIGKLITGTRAVMMDGTPMRTETIFLRNLIRAVPFNPLSALGPVPKPWHDAWSRTTVVKQ